MTAKPKTRAELIKQGLHQDLNVILDALDAAHEAVSARGYRTNVRPNDGRRSSDDEALNPIEAAAARGDKASAWLKEQEAVLRNLTFVANTARVLFPPPLQPGEVVQGVTVGSRSNEVEVCWFCGEPAPAGRDEHGQSLTKRCGDHLFMFRCYHLVYTRARRRNLEMSAYIAHLEEINPKESNVTMLDFINMHPESGL